MHSPALLKLLYLVSPSLPVGAYAYSQGQEYAVDSTWVSSESALSDWILGVMRHSLGTTDIPYLMRAYAAWQKNDHSALNEMNQILRASRETHELLLEDEQLGLAFARLLKAHGIDAFTKLETKKPSFVLLFALAGLEWQIPLDELLHGFVWSWLENQVAAATKSIPLGQTQAQKILLTLLDEIPPVIKVAETLDDDELGSGLPGLAMASCLHERQYSRLFRS